MTMKTTQTKQKHQAMIMATLSVVLVAAMPAVDSALAFHYSLQRWITPQVSIAYDLTSLGNLKDANGNALGWQAVTNRLDVARLDWNSLPSQFWFDRLTSTGNMVVATPLTGTTIAQVQCAWFVWLLDCDMKFNSNFRWTTTSTGTPASNIFSISNTARHEFGHYVKFNDVYDRTDTVMYGYYTDSIYQSIKTNDSTELTGIYG